MNFDDVLNDIQKLIGFPLKAINPSTPNITILSIDFDTKKYVVKSEDSKSELKRNLRELDTIYNSLKRDGYCNVEQALQGSFTSRHQPETIFANLPYIKHFKFERKKHLVLQKNDYHPLGEIQELPLSDQRRIRKALISRKGFSLNALGLEIEQTLVNLKGEINSLHIKQPGFLADTKIREVIHAFEKINESVQQASISFKNHQIKLNDETIERARKDSFDMSDLVDLSSITGVTDDNSEDRMDSNESSKEEDLASQLTVPNIRRQTPSLSTLYQRLIYDEIEIQPDYQRKDRIWSDDKKSKLIESVLMGLPLPIFYFGERKNDNWVVIDGLQRLTTVHDFMQGKFALKLDEESTVYDANGKFFKEFDRPFTRAINEFEITAYVIDMDESSANIDSINQFIIELFHRINTYGVKLSNQEIRSAIKFGNSVFYLKFLASSQTFISATNDTINPKRQKDLELCLSALAFIIFGYKNFSANKYGDFLIDTMGWINDQSFTKTTTLDGEVDYRSESSEIINLTSRFEASLNLCKEIFGQDSFKKVKNARKQEPISKTLFEVLVTTFANIDDIERELIRKHKEDFVTELYSAIRNDSGEFAEWSSNAYSSTGRGLNYSLSTSTGKKVTINYRFEAILNILEKTTGCNVNIIPLVK